MKKATSPRFSDRTGNWDDICRRCGLCCHEKGLYNGYLFIKSDRTCSFLSKEKACTVYGERFVRCKDCRKLGVLNALFTSYLPSVCGYVARFRPWRKKKKLIFL